MSGNIWAALRIALSMMDQPELFQAANIGDLDLLMRAFNLDIWRVGVSEDLISRFSHPPISAHLANAQGEHVGVDVCPMHVRVNYSHPSCHLLCFFFFFFGTLEQFLGAGSSNGSEWLLCDEICTAIYDFPEEHKDERRLYEQCLRGHIN